MLYGGFQLTSDQVVVQLVIAVTFYRLIQFRWSLSLRKILEQAFSETTFRRLNPLKVQRYVAIRTSSFDNSALVPLLLRGRWFLFGG